MNKKIIIAPSLLAADFSRLKEEIQENLDKVEASVEELPVEDEEFEDIVFDEDRKSVV